MLVRDSPSVFKVNKESFQFKFQTADYSSPTGGNERAREGISGNTHGSICAFLEPHISLLRVMPSIAQEKRGKDGENFNMNLKQQQERRVLPFK